MGIACTSCEVTFAYFKAFGSGIDEAKTVYIMKQFKLVANSYLTVAQFDNDLFECMQTRIQGIYQLVANYDLIFEI